MLSVVDDLLDVYFCFFVDGVTVGEGLVWLFAVESGWGLGGWGNPWPFCAQAFSSSTCARRGGVCVFLLHLW